MRLILTLMAAGAAFSIPAAAARMLTLEEAQALAAQNNRGLKLARLKIEEVAHKREGARADYYPKAFGNANYLYFNQKIGTTVTGNELGLGFLPPPYPSIPVPLNLVKQNLFLGSVTVAQPLTQMLKVQQGVRVASSERDIATAESAKSEDDVRYAVEQVYYGLLVAQHQRVAAEAKVSAAEEQLKDAQNAVETGNALKVASLGRRAALLEARQNFQSVADLEADYTDALNVLIGLPPNTELAVAEPQRPDVHLKPVEDVVHQALERSPEVREARANIEKARAGVHAAQADYIPDITAVVEYFHQDGVPTLPGNFGAIGATANYTLFDFGKRRDMVRERRSQLAEAEENLKRVEDTVGQEVRKSVRNVERSLQMVNVAREALELRQESERLTKDQFELGLALKSAYAESTASRISAEVDLLRAEAGWRLELAALRRQTGQL